MTGGNPAPARVIRIPDPDLNTFLATIGVGDRPKCPVCGHDEWVMVGTPPGDDFELTGHDPSRGPLGYSFPGGRLRQLRALWQHTNDEEWPGIGHCDCSIFDGDLEEVLAKIHG